MSTTLCIRCGKQRILFKKWTETLGSRGNTMICETYVCPDSDCQKIVDQKFAEMRQKRVDSENRKSNLHLKKN